MTIERFNAIDCIAPAQKKSSVNDSIQQLDQILQTVEVGYTSGGNPAEPCPECNTDSINCYAKKQSVIRGNVITDKYFVMTGQNGFLFDPWGIFAEGSQHREAMVLGRPSWSFTEVNKRAFEFYKMFLQTRNSAWKNNAEREIKNA